MNLRNLDQKKLMGLLYDQYEFQELPPSVDEFLDSPYYLGVGQPGSMWNFVYPFWREKLRELFQNPITVKSTYILEGGSIGELTLPIQNLTNSWESSPIKSFMCNDYVI